MSANEQFANELAEALNSEFLRECKLKFLDAEGPTGGNTTKTFLAELTGIDEKDEIRTYQVFIKCGKELQGEIMPEYEYITRTYAIEQHMYKSVFPALKSYAKESKVRFDLDYLSECYGTPIVNNIPTIVLENLREGDFKLHDTFRAMNLDHIKLVFKAYAKLHANSFALRETKPEQYKELTKALENGFDLWSLELYKDAYEEHTEYLCQQLIEDGHQELMQKWKKYLEKGSLSKFKEFPSITKEETIIIHGDCWNNNFLFKYQNDDETPIHVKIIDYQQCEDHSPVLDLAAFFYLNCSKNAEEHFEDLLEYYYQHFAKYLKEFNYDPETVFPLTKLKRHWRIYSIIPALRTWHMCHIPLRAKVIKIEDVANPVEFAFSKEFKVKDENLYKERLLTIVKNFFDCQEKYMKY